MKKKNKKNRKKQKKIKMNFYYQNEKLKQDRDSKLDEHVILEGLSDAEKIKVCRLKIETKELLKTRKVLLDCRRILKSRLSHFNCHNKVKIMNQKRIRKKRIRKKILEGRRRKKEKRNVQK